MTTSIDRRVERASRRLATRYTRRSLLARAATAAAAMSAARLWGSLLPAWASTSPPDPELTAKRESLFRDYVTRQKNLSPPAIPSGQTPCDAWNHLSAAAQGVFLTLTHRLYIAQIHTSAGFQPLLSHVTALYSIRGDDDSDPCGGGDDNRMFLSIDQPLHEALTAIEAGRDGGSDPTIRDFGPLGTAQTATNRRWRRSGDIGGVHKPFNASVESNMGRRLLLGGGPGVPRAQVQFYCDRDHPTTAVRLRCRAKKPIMFPGTTRGRDLAGVQDIRLLEMDQDYDRAHHSSTECNTENGVTGRVDYERNYYTNAPAGVPSVDFAWKPNCGGGGGGGGGGGDDCFGVPCGPQGQCPPPCGCFGGGPNRLCGQI